MSRRAYFSHVNPDGHSPFDRLRRASIGFTAAAENIAFGQHSARHVLRSWIDSPGHRVSLENCNYTHHGVGFDGRNWTHILLRP